MPVHLMDAGELVKRLNWEHSQIIVNLLSCQCQLVSRPYGTRNCGHGPTDKSVGYFHLSQRDKMHVYKKMGMHTIELAADLPG